MGMCVKTRGEVVVEGVAAGVLFGTSAIFTRFLVGLDAFSVTFWRLLIASLALVTIASLIISFIGVCLIAYAETPSSQLAGISPTLKGDLEAAFAALLIAFYLNYGKVLRGKTGLSTSIVPIYLFGRLWRFSGFGGYWHGFHT